MYLIYQYDLTVMYQNEVQNVVHSFVKFLSLLYPLMFHFYSSLLSPGNSLTGFTS